MKIEIIWTKHAEERQKDWQRKLLITREEVEEVVQCPEQIVPGDKETFIAQKRMKKGLLRVPFIEVSDNKRKILTVYWTSRVERYWQEE